MEPFVPSKESQSSLSSQASGAWGEARSCRRRKTAISGRFPRRAGSSQHLGPVTPLDSAPALQFHGMGDPESHPWWPSGDGRWPNISWLASFARWPRRRGEKLHFFPVILELSALHIWEILLSNSLSDGLWSQLISSSSPSV